MNAAWIEHIVTRWAMRPIAVALFIAAAGGGANAATVVLYDQNFENPAAFNNDGADVNIFTPVNTLYGGQPPGFSFAQTFTVETLNVSGSARGAGTAAFGTGYSDPSGRAGNFMLGMLSTGQQDLLGLSFDVGAFEFLNLSIDITSIDLSAFGGPFVPPGQAGVPEFQFTLFDNPTGANGTGSGTILDQKTLTGTESARTVVDFTSDILALSTLGNTNGEVILQIDLLTGGYGGFDNIVIASSDDPGTVGDVPLPAALPLLLSGLGLLGLLRLRRKAA